MLNRLDCRSDDGFHEWLDRSGGSLLISAYDANAVLSIGCRAGQISVLARRFDKPMGLALAGKLLAIASRHAITEFANDVALAQDYDPAAPGRYDALYLPRTVHLCNDVNVHDLGYTRDEQLVFANTRFSCLARPAAQASFEATWLPHFVSELVPEDRCHLNGLAMRDGEPAYVSLFALSDRAAGWRECPFDGGRIVETASQTAVAEGLCMPHSPRWHHGRLWALESGQGRLLRIDPATGQRDTIQQLPGYARGLCLVDDTALVCLSKARERHIFADLPVLRRHDRLCCGVAAVNIQSGRCIGTLTMEGAVSELFDVCFVRGARAANLLQVDHPKNQQVLSTAAGSYWLREENRRD